MPFYEGLLFNKKPKPFAPLTWIKLIVNTRKEGIYLEHFNKKLIPEEQNNIMSIFRMPYIRNMNAKAADEIGLFVLGALLLLVNFLFFFVRIAQLYSWL
jgi:hypothetical protein